MKTRLTAKAVDAISPADKSFTAWDAEINGLGLRVRPTGNKTWILFYRNSSGRQRNYTIGKHGKLTAMEARRIGKQLAAQVALGKDIQAERIETRQQAQDEANKHSLSSFIESSCWLPGACESSRPPCSSLLCSRSYWLNSRPVSGHAPRRFYSPHHTGDISPPFSVSPILKPIRKSGWLKLGLSQGARHC